MAKKFFGTDGIRGRANVLITPELALKVGEKLQINDVDFVLIKHP